MPIPADYAERVYAGVLGKIIGVYLGRPFENWSHARIEERLGEIGYYVNGSPALEAAKRGAPVVQPDDDIAGTFTFLRALSDYGNGKEISAAQIGQTWLNYVVEERSTFWWGGVGLSTEHTAYMRLRDGVQAPDSGSAALNGKVLSEQIGAQIFVDGWALVAPGDPDLAADLARRAARVSHDGEAVYAAQVVAAMEALAFVENDLRALLDAALAQIPRDSTIARLIGDLREWHAAEPDWRRARARIEQRYGYDSYGGNCPVVPNHALIVMALLYGEDDFRRSLSIVNTSGWDTDCNSGNVGCLLGIKNGLVGMDAGPDWRGPVADRMYLSSADGGRAITDALSEAHRIADLGRALAGEPPEAPDGRPRFGFELPGAVQGFAGEPAGSVENVELDGRRALAIRLEDGGARTFTATFVQPEAIECTDESLLAAPWLYPGRYGLLASPTLYPGHTVSAHVSADGRNAGPVLCRLAARHYDSRDELSEMHGPAARLEPGGARALEWRVEDTGGQPIAQIGIEITAELPVAGAVHLHQLTWAGAPDAAFTRPAGDGRMWRRAWVQAVDRFEPYWPEPFRLTQNRGRGLLIQGTREWDDYDVSAAIRPEMIAAAGIAARVQGLRRYYALLLCADDTARLVKVLDGEAVLAEAPVPREYRGTYDLELTVQGSSVRACVGGETLLAYDDDHRPLEGGGVAFVCEQGSMTSERIAVRRLGAAPDATVRPARSRRGD